MKTEANFSGLNAVLDLKRAALLPVGERPEVTISVIEEDESNAVFFGGLKLNFYGEMYMNSVFWGVNFTLLDENGEETLFEWLPEEKEDPRYDGKVTSLTVHWQSGQRVGLEEKTREEFFSQLPKEGTKEIEEAMLLEREIVLKNPPKKNFSD